DFDFPHPDLPTPSSGTLGTAQNFTMNAAIPRMLLDEGMEISKTGFLNGFSFGALQPTAMPSAQVGIQISVNP
ncbi:MAG: hypothetical protein WBD95_09160, partial [Xanthobacteraceae bacterium]